MILMDGGIPPATDAAGRLLDGDDLDVTSQTSAAHASQTLATATGLKRRILFVTCQYSSAVSLSVTITLISALGAGYNTTLATLVFSSNQSGLWVPATSRFVLAPGDQLQVVAPDGGVGVTSAVAIYDEILGLTARATDATS